MANDFLAQLLALNDASQARTEYVRASFGYPGGKSRSIPNLLSILPYRKVWVDVCAGSGAVTLARNESSLEVFNDRCAGVTAFFRCAQSKEKCQRLVERLQITICSREEFMWCSDTWHKDQLDDVERAARWYYAVQHSFNSKGWIFGRVTSGKAQCQKVLNNLNLFWPIHHRMKRVYVENQDWRILMNDYNNEKNANAGTVWYIDPPYWLTGGNYMHEMRPEHHLELAERCMHLDGFVALSGYDTPDHPYNRFKWDKKEQWEVQVSMTGMAFTESNHLIQLKDTQQRGTAIETVWIRDSAR